MKKKIRRNSVVVYSILKSLIYKNTFKIELLLYFNINLKMQ